MRFLSSSKVAQWCGVFSVVILFGYRLCAADVPGAGSVGLPFPGNGEGCASCSASIGKDERAGIILNISMGRALHEGSAGEFQLRETRLQLRNATPAELMYSAETDPDRGIECIKSMDGTILQVVTPTAFATVTADSSFSYSIRIYDLKAMGPLNGTTHEVIPGARYLKNTWTIDNPDGAVSTCNRLRITETPLDEPTKTWMYSYDGATFTWTLSTPDNLSEQRICQTYDATTQNPIYRVQFAVPNGAVLYERTQEYCNYPWGQALITDTIGKADDQHPQQVTRYFYLTAAQVPAYTPTSSKPPIDYIIRPDGSWEKRTAYDGMGRPTIVYSGYDGAVSTTTTTCYETDYNFGSLDPSALWLLSAARRV